MEESNEVAVWRSGFLKRVEVFLNEVDDPNPATVDQFLEWLSFRAADYRGRGFWPLRPDYPSAQFSSVVNTGGRYAPVGSLYIVFSRFEQDRGRGRAEIRGRLYERVNEEGAAVPLPDSPEITLALFRTINMGRLRVVIDWAAGPTDVLWDIDLLKTKVKVNAATYGSGFEWPLYSDYLRPMFVDMAKVWPATAVALNEALYPIPTGYAARYLSLSKLIVARAVAKEQLAGCDGGDTPLGYRERWFGDGFEITLYEGSKAAAWLTVVKDITGRLRLTYWGFKRYQVTQDALKSLVARLAPEAQQANDVQQADGDADTKIEGRYGYRLAGDVENMEAEREQLSLLERGIVDAVGELKEEYMKVTNGTIAACMAKNHVYNPKTGEAYSEEHISRNRAELRRRRFDMD